MMSANGRTGFSGDALRTQLRRQASSADNRRQLLRLEMFRSGEPVPGEWQDMLARLSAREAEATRRQ